MSPLPLQWHPSKSLSLAKNEGWLEGKAYRNFTWCLCSPAGCIRPLFRPDPTILTYVAFTRKFDNRIGDASAESRFLILTRYRVSAYHTQYTRGTSHFAGVQTSAYGAGEL